jgi:hypothetical protein
MARIRGDIRRLEALLQAWEPQIREAFIAAVMSTRRGIDVRALEAALEARDIGRAVELLRVNQALLFPLEAAISGTYVAGGQMIAAGAPAGAAVFGFDGRHFRAEAWVRQNVGGLITGIIDDQRETVVAAVRDVIERQLAAGLAPRQAALDITGRVNRATGMREGGILGLDGPRAERLRIVTEAMRTPEGVRGLVIERRDGTLAMRYQVNKATELRILRAHRAGEALSAGDQALSARQYGNALLQARGQTIARTESITALRAGRHEGIQQAIEQGAIDRERVKRVWDATMDARTRPDHRAMHGTAVEDMDAPFVLPDGSRMMYPGDTSMGASAEQTINCRCFERFEVDWLRGDEQPGGANDGGAAAQASDPSSDRAFDIEDYDVVGREGDFTYAENRIPAYTEHDTSGVMESYRHDQEIAATFREMAIDNEVVFGEREIQLSDLTSFQSTVRLENLRPILENFDLEKFVGADPATVFILPDGQYVLRDGNHRINAALANRVQSATFQTIQFVPRSGRMPGYDTR